MTIQSDWTVGSLPLAGKADFGIVIPHLGLNSYLVRCLRSVVHQEGEFSVHVHVQDGGSPLNTVEQLRVFENEFSSVNRFVTVAVQEDSGPAQAVNRGLNRVNANMVTWLGADDILLPGALQAVFSLVRDFPEIDWVTGVPQVIDESGVAFSIDGPLGFPRPPVGWPREALKRGWFYDSYNFGALQQEGTFWKKDLWRSVGGLDEDLKLAFDFSLWTKFAEYSELVQVSMPLAAFRRRKSQLSSDEGGYLEEVLKLRRQIRERTSGVSPRGEKLLAKIYFFGPSDVKWRSTTVEHRLVGSGSRTRRPLKDALRNAPYFIGRLSASRLSGRPYIRFLFRQLRLEYLKLFSK